MSQSLYKLYIHVVFGTKRHLDTLPKNELNRVHSCIGAKVNECGCQSIIVGGTQSHVHILCELSAIICIADLVKRVKTHTTKWLKETFDECDTFCWQGGYAAMSVSKSAVERAYYYIANQEEHHRKINFIDEVRDLSKAYDMPFDEKYWMD